MVSDFNSEQANTADLAYQTPGIIRQRQKTLEAMALETGHRALDVGCGTGLLLEDIARAVGQQGDAVGIDLSADMLQLARARCAGLSQVSLIRGTVADGLTSQSRFDAISYVQVLRYIADVQGELRRAAMLLKPGGRLVVVETDWRGTVLNTDYPNLTQKILDAHDTEAASPNLPVRLPALLTASGCRVASVDAVPVLETDWAPGTFSHSMFRKYAGQGVAQDAVSEEEAAQWLDDFDRKGKAGEFFFCVNRFLFSGLKVEAQEQHL